MSRTTKLTVVPPSPPPSPPPTTAPDYAAFDSWVKLTDELGQCLECILGAFYPIDNNSKPINPEALKAAERTLRGFDRNKLMRMEELFYRGLHRYNADSFFEEIHDEFKDRADFRFAATSSPSSSHHSSGR